MTSPLFRWQFRPPLWSVVGTLLAVSAMMALGVWQYQRGQQKQHLLDEHAKALRLPAADLQPDTPLPAPGEMLHVQVRGHFDAAKAVLLDNQSHRHQPGVHAWVPFMAADGSVVIVDRGWLPLVNGEPPIVTAPPTGELILTGYWRSLPRPGMRLGGAPAACAATRPTRINFPNFAECRCLFGPQLREGLLELAPDTPGSLGRDWQAGGKDAVPPQRHYGYAAQWWAFALTLLGIFIKLNFRKLAS